MSVPLDAPHELHRISDPEAGDQLLVVTAFAPARGVIHTQNFHRVPRARLASRVWWWSRSPTTSTWRSAPDKVVISRPERTDAVEFAASAVARQRPASADVRSPALGVRPQRHRTRSGNRNSSPPPRRRRRTNVWRRGSILPASISPARCIRRPRACSTSTLAQERPAAEDVTAARAARRRRDHDGQARRRRSRTSTIPAVGDQHDAPLWRALAYARQGKWGEARESFKRVEAAIATLPIELQRFALKEEMRASIEVGDFAGAENELNDLQTIGIPHNMQPAMSVLIGRLDEGIGRTEDALAAYRAAADSWDRPAAAQGRLRETVLRYSLGDLKRDGRRRRISESLTTVWRGDETEIEALQVLARLYTEERPLSRLLLRDAQRHGGASGLGHDAQNPGGGGKDVRCAVPRRQGRRAVGDRCARLVLRFPRTDPDRQPRRRDDPPARRPAGIRRSARSGRRSVAVSGR